MSNKKRKGPGSGTVFMLLMVGALGLGGLTAYVTGFGPASKVPQMERRTEEKDPIVTSRRGSRGDEGEQVSRAGKPDRLLVPALEGEKVRLKAVESRQADPKRYVANQTLKALGLTQGEVKAVTLAGGVARIDLEREVLSGMGSMQESTLLKAFQMALGQFPEVEMIRFAVDGQEIETLGGHVEVIDGVEVIRPSMQGEKP